MTKHPAFTGSLPALVTPFKGGRIDEDALRALVDWQIENGSSGLVPVGTTGESPTLSHDEHRRVVEIVIAQAKGRVPVIAGAGSNNTTEAIDLAVHAEKAGAQALLVVTPYYNRPTQAGLMAHFSTVARATSLPVMLYSVPARCGVEIAPETCAALMDRHANIVAIKEAGGNPGRVTQLRRACGERLIIHSGDDALTLPFLSLGASGVTSVVSNIAPGGMVRMVEAWKRGDIAQALALNDAMAELTEGMFIESSPGPVKAALAISNLAGPELRLPMVPVSDANRERLAGILGRYQKAAASFQEMR